jgi:hypothetical protein
MSTIRTICPHCVSPVDLEPAELILLTSPDPAVCGTYLFVCSTCEQVAVKTATTGEIALLTAAGVRPAPPAGQAATLPAGSGNQPGGRPFTRDDLLDFHQLLTSDDWLVALLAAERPAS